MDAEALSRTLRSDLASLSQRAVSAGRGAERIVEQTVEAQPFVAVAAALGIGFALGGGLRGRVGTLLLGTFARAAATWVADELQRRGGADFDPAGLTS